MNRLDFGRRLRLFRQQCSDPATGKQLSQQRLGELLQDEVGIRYSGAAISDWERGESVISAGDRLILLALLRVLTRLGGIQTLSDANSLLEAGNYRSLNDTEAGTIFPNNMESNQPVPTVPSNAQMQNSGILSNGIFLRLAAKWSQLKTEAREGPPPIWPRVVALAIRRVTDQITPVHLFRAVIWVWIGVIAYFLIVPSLRFFSALSADPLPSLVTYAVGSLVLPLFIGAMTQTKDNPFWRELKTVKPFHLRLYTYQGAYVGFHVGYFMLFLLSYVQNLILAHSPPWLGYVQVAFLIAVGYAGAQLIPHNLWLAYGRLRLQEAGIFFVFTLLGPVWAWFLWEFREIMGSPILGGFTMAAAITLLAAGALKKHSQRYKNTRRE